MRSLDSIARSPSGKIGPKFIIGVVISGMIVLTVLLLVRDGRKELLPAQSGVIAALNSGAESWSKSVKAQLISTDSHAPVAIADDLGSCGRPLKPHVAPVTEVVHNCPDEDLYLLLWTLLTDYQAPDRRGRPLTMVDIGSNKGYSVAGMIEALNLTVPPHSCNDKDWNYDPNCVNGTLPSEKIAARSNGNSAGWMSRTALAMDITKHSQSAGHTRMLIGACFDGAHPPLVSPEREAHYHRWFRSREAGGIRTGSVFVPSVEAFLIDGSAQHVEYTRAFFNDQNQHYVGYNTKHNLPITDFKFSFIHAAASNKDGTLRFCETQMLGGELSKICNDQADGVNVPMTTLNKMLPESVPFIDILLTDTEGNDFDVFEGGVQRWFKPGNVGIYVFETHIGKNTRTLRNILEELEGYGYSCYFPVTGADRFVVPLSPVKDCFLDRYETEGRGWKNVVCANTAKRPELKIVFSELANMPRRPQPSLDFGKRFPWKK